MKNVEVEHTNTMFTKDIIFSNETIIEFPK